MRRVLYAAALAVAAQAVVFAAGFLPLEPGNRWIYREFETGQSFTITVGTPFEIGGGVYFSLKGYANQTLLVRHNRYGNLVYRDEERDQDVLLTSFEIVPKAWFEAPFRPCRQEGQVGEEPGFYAGYAGPYSRTRQISYRGDGCPDANLESEEYVENIGLVSRTVSTIAGPRTFELVYARVSRATVVDALPHGNFSVGYLKRSAAPVLDVTLRLAVDEDRPLRLTFPSSAETEVRIADLEGRVLWSSLNGQVYAPQVHERSLGYYEWNVPVPMVLPNGERLDREKHVIAARLLTSGALQFASAVPYRGF